MQTRLPYLILTLFLSVFAQGQTNRLNFVTGTPPITLHGTDTLVHGFSGGLDFPQWSKVDLNRDNVDDLVAFDRQGNRWVCFLAKNNTWELAPAYSDSLPAVENWALFRDYNCDGKQDLFCYIQGGIGVFENTSTADSLKFQWALPGPYLRTLVNGNTPNLYNFASDIPGIIDVDGDGDLDIFTFSQGSSIEWHKGTTSCGLDFAYETGCWGRFHESATTNDITLDGCIGVQKNSGGLHAGSAILIINLNGDTLQDLLLSDVSYNTVIAALNDGTNDSAHMYQKINYYPPGDSTYLHIFPGMFYEDVDFDNVPDLICAPNLEGAKNTHQNWLYSNSGAANNPNWDTHDSTFLVGEMIDLGSGAYPAFVDMDFDGDYDLVVGTYGEFKSPGVYESKMAYYKNIGNTNAPKFKLQNQDLAGAGAANLGLNLSPTFGDLDGDFDPDMIVGADNGQLYYYKNTGTMFSPTFSYQGAIGSIDVGNAAAPHLTDMDGDGDLDLIIGCEQGTLTYYERTGTGATDFTLVSNNWGAVNTQGFASSLGYSYPYTVQDSMQTLMVGSAYLGVQHLDSLDFIVSGASTTNVVLAGGTMVSASQTQTPFGASKRTGRNQIRLTADEIIAGGGSYGKISSIGFEFGTLGSNYLTQGFTLSLKHTSDTAMNYMDSTGFTEVFDGIKVFGSGWNDIQFITPFSWNGTDDILVQICFSKNAQTTDLPVKLVATSHNSYCYGDVSNWNSIFKDGCSMPYGGKYKQRPNMKLTIAPALRKNDTHFAQGYRTAPAFADLTGDGIPDAVVGNFSGGLRYYEGVPFNDISVAEPPVLPRALKVYPNPSTGTVHIALHNPIAQLALYNSQGQLVAAQKGDGTAYTTIQLNKPSGLYILKVQGEDGGIYIERILLR